MILYSLRKHLNPHTREISKSEKIKANEPCVDWIIQCVLYHGIQVWKICKHKMKSRHHMSHCNGLNKNLADLFCHRSQLIIISILKQVSRTPPRITLPSLSTATPLNYTSWSHGWWERIHFGVSRWRFHWHNFLLSGWVIFPIWDVWKMASRRWKRFTALDQFYRFFQIRCHRNARMNTPHNIG